MSSQKRLSRATHESADVEDNSSFESFDDIVSELMGGIPFLPNVSGFATESV